MKKFQRLISILIVLCMVIPLTFVTGVSAASTAIFNSIPDPLPGNLPSQPYQAQQATEVGDYIHFAGTERNLSSVTVTMSGWALHSEYPAMPAAGFNHDLTLNIYNVDKSGATPALGSLIKTVTKNFVMQWRPAEDPTNCPTKDNPGYAYKWQKTPGAPDTNCYNGFVFNVVFDLSSEGITLPDEIIYGIASNTQTYGNPPIGVPGPYNSLNFALNTTVPSVGTDVEPDAVFWNTITAGWYTGGGITGTFRRDTGWTPYVPAIRFDVTLAPPVPGTSIVPTTDTPLFCTGETSKVKINLNDVANLYGYQFQVNYDATKVSATGAFNNSFFDTTGDYAPWNATCSAGTCKFSVSKLAPQTPSNGSGTVAEINFTGLQVGEFDVTIGAGDILSDRDANVIGHTVGGPVHLTVCGFATVNGVVSLQGRPTPINSGTVTLTGAFGPYSANFNSSTGAWSIPNIKVMPGGTNYTFDAAHGLYLGNRMTHALMPGETYAAAATKLKGGDADNTGLIDVSDITCISGSFGAAPVTCGATGSSDINADGLVNILDLVLPGGNYGLLAPQGW
ncbi:MAG: cohesin domain-containing protein [Chloroflexi bacterium]|nr:cohesin domain-containing protein [Chloroflexota bacterium]